MKQLGALALTAFLALPAAAQREEVTLPGPDVELSGLLYTPEGEGPFPAVIMLHGCGGLFRGGKPTPSYDFWARHFQSRDHVALLLDSFGPRGRREVCTLTERPIRPERERAQDAHAALRWLAARPGVRPASIHLVGWSNGGSTVLHAIRKPGTAPAPGQPAFRSAVALYPGCAALARQSYEPSSPLLIQAGGADDWTPAKHCEALALQATQRAGKVEIDVYEGAHHGFDRIDGRVRFRANVRNPTSPTGLGATVGPHPEARAKALERTSRFIETHH